MTGKQIADALARCPHEFEIPLRGPNLTGMIDPSIHSEPGECACGAPYCPQCADAYWKVRPRSQLSSQASRKSTVVRDITFLVFVGMSLLGGLWSFPLAMMAAIYIAKDKA